MTARVAAPAEGVGRDGAARPVVSRVAARGASGESGSAGAEREGAARDWDGAARPVISRLAAGCVLLASAVAGLLFAPVFGLWALVLPVVVVIVV
ncbi:MAG TPA: hypothetical protein VHC18_25700, partial [Amycolatopsis sp.]|nr:hypothetical protein [Amycolatopsis sp.]